METIKKNRIKIKNIITALENGAVLVLPTDTVYGFVCDATNKKAVEKIYKIKERAKNKYLPLFVKNIKMAEDLSVINNESKKIIVKKWPGKFTFVLNKKSKIKMFGVDKKTVALRVPKYKLLNSLLNKIRIPLAQTSANISGQLATTKINEVIKYFEGKKYQPDLIIDCGNLPKNKPSIIIDLTNNNNIKVIRN